MLLTPPPPPPPPHTHTHTHTHTFQRCIFNIRLNSGKKRRSNHTLLQLALRLLINYQLFMIFVLLDFLFNQRCLNRIDVKYLSFEFQKYYLIETPQHRFRANLYGRHPPPYFWTMKKMSDYVRKVCPQLLGNRI